VHGNPACVQDPQAAARQRLMQRPDRTHQTRTRNYRRTVRRAAMRQLLRACFRIYETELPRVFRTREFAVILRGFLHSLVLVHDLLRGPVPDCGVKAFPIVAQLDVARDVLTRFPACRVDGPVHALDFQCAIE
jgi:hypothetical protein